MRAKGAVRTSSTWRIRKAKAVGIMMEATVSLASGVTVVDKVEAVKLLVSKYGMTNIDALIEYEKFFKKYPSGLIKKEEFLEEYKVSQTTF